MKELLLQLDEILRMKNIELYKKLDGPLTNEAIDHMSNRLKFQLPPEVKDLYKWKNGTVMSNNLPLGSFWMMPLNTFTDLGSSVQYHLETLNKYSDKIPENLFPIFQSGGGERTFIDINPISPSFGKLFFYTLSDPDVDVFSTYGDSLDLFLKSIIQCYQVDIYYCDDSGFLNCNEKGESQIFFKNNPLSEYWRFYSEVYS